jgi:disks large-associated protein 5
MSPTSESAPPTAAHFRQLYTAEAARLATICETWEAKMPSITALLSGAQDEEAIVGQVRTTIGQGRLLMNRKGRFEQFSGLVDNCENNRGEMKTTVMDLQGFWDMVYFQVEDVDRKFVDLEKLEAVGWKKEEEKDADIENSPPKKLKQQPVKRKAAAPAAPAVAAKAAKVRAGLKEMMAAKRREMAAKTEATTTTLKVSLFTCLHFYGGLRSISQSSCPGIIYTTASVTVLNVLRDGNY